MYQIIGKKSKEVYGTYRVKRSAIEDIPKISKRIYFTEDLKIIGETK